MSDTCLLSSSIIERYIPKHMRQRIRPEDIARKHRDHSELLERECNEAYMSFIRQWSLYGSTIFDVLQSYTTTLPKNLWLAVNEWGVHILKRREKEPLVSYEYKDIVNYRCVCVCVCVCAVRVCVCVCVCMCVLASWGTQLQQLFVH